jgi:hypothetical protein
MSLSCISSHSIPCRVMDVQAGISCISPERGIAGYEQSCCAFYHNERTIYTFLLLMLASC